MSGYRVWRIQNGQLTVNPIRNLAQRRENNGRIRFLESEEEVLLRQTIRDVVPTREPELDLALHSGMRRAEQYQLRWEHVDLRRGFIRIVKSKNGERRMIHINPIAQTALEALLKHRDQSGYVVIPGKSGDREHDSQRWFEDAVEAAGIRNFRWHDLRHTFASRLAMAGVDLRTIAELLGHKTLVMVMRYAHLAPGHMKSAVDRLVPFAKTDTTTDAAPKSAASVEKRMVM